MKALIEQIRSSARVLVYPPNGLPILPDGKILTAELESFYGLCGGMVFDPAGKFPIEILGPDKFRLANTEMFSGFSGEEIAKTFEHPSWSWFIIAECQSDIDEKVVVDLSQPTSPCYDCYWVTYPGNSEEIAPSFVDFLQKLFKYQGDYIFWK